MPAFSTRARRKTMLAKLELSSTHAEWLEDVRKIPSEIAAEMGFVSRGSNLAFEFRRNGELLFRKMRRETPEGKTFFIEPSGSPLILFNEDCLNEPCGPDVPLIICEGEIDAASWAAAGATRVVSVPNGAAGKPGEGDIVPSEDRQFAYLWKGDALLPGLQRFSKIILATDSDRAGLVLRDELAIRLGRSRCYVIEYPTGCKDANDVLQKHENGAEILMHMIDEARPIVPNKLVPLLDIPERGVRMQYSTGWSGLDPHIRIVPPELIVVTGAPGSGKSQWTLAMCMNLARIHGLRGAILQFEDNPDRNRRDVLAYGRAWSQSEGAGVGHDFQAWARRMFFAISPKEDDDGQVNFNLEWLQRAIEEAATRHGCRWVLIDPWNEVEHVWNVRENETNYTNAALRDLKRIARRYQIALIIVAHPSKGAEAKTIDDASLYDVSGCYSDDTDVLTRRGWLPHAAINHADEIACFDPETSDVVWHQPSRIIRKDFTGEMFRFRGDAFDLLVTPDHRMVVRPTWDVPVGTQATTGIGRPEAYSRRAWSFKSADEIPPTSALVIPRAGNEMPGASPETIMGFGAGDFMRLLGWWIAEGCFASSGMSICQRLGENEMEISDVLDAMGVCTSTRINPPTNKGGKFECRTWYIGARKNKALIEFFKKNCGENSAARRIPDFVFDLSPGLKREFLEAYLRGDGSVKGTGRSASTTSPILRDQLQRLAVELGIPTSASVIGRGKDHHAEQYQINLNGGHRKQASLRGYRHISREHYSGYVWCLTVPTGAYFVRRNGGVVACGNSAAWKNKADHGIIIARDREDRSITFVKIDKSKDWSLMGQPGIVRMQFEPQRASFNFIKGNA